MVFCRTFFGLAEIPVTFIEDRKILGGLGYKQLNLL